MEEDGFGLVVARVTRDENGVHVGRHGEEDAVTQPARRGLDALALSPQPGNVHREEPVRDAEPGGQRGAEAGVEEPRLAPQSVRDVESDDRGVAGSRPAAEEEEERRRIAPARASHGEPARPFQETGFGDVPGEADGQALGHAALSPPSAPGSGIDQAA